MAGFWLVLLTVGTISMVALYRLNRLRVPAEKHSNHPPAESALVASAVCLTYPHALIPCGLSSNDELQRARESDGQLEEHYAEVGFVRPEVLKADELDYVSYRLGSKIVWTSKRLLIHAGEKVLKDRSGNTIRGRCGNRLSRVPMMPAPPLLPPDIEFERPLIAGLVPFVPEVPPGLAPVVPGIPTEVPALPPYVAEVPPLEAPVVPSGPSPFIPLIPLIPIIPIAVGSPGGTPIFGFPVAPPVATPEPGTVWFSVAGVLLVLGERYRRSRSRGGR